MGFLPVDFARIFDAVSRTDMKCQKCKCFAPIIAHPERIGHQGLNSFIRLNVCPLKSYLVFCTDNSVTYDVLKINPELLSTKEDANNHGIGTKVLRKIAEQYDGILSYEMF